MKLVTRVASIVAGMPVAGRFLRWFARQYKEGSVVKIPLGHAAGIKWNRSHRHVSGYWSGLYELEIQELLARELKPGMVFYDVGANAGFFTMLAAKLVGPEGKIVAFEPLSENIRSIEDQVELNGFQHCKVVAAAVSDISGQGQMMQAANLSMGRLSSSATVPGTLEVLVVTLDDVVATTPYPDFIKIDVEGAEVDVLEGAKNLLVHEPRPRWLIELHGYEKATGVWRVLTNCGYTITDIAGDVLNMNENLPAHILAFVK